MIHPAPEKLRALADRWQGQDARLQRIAEALLAGEDWTRHLRGLPYIDEVPPRDGEAYGRDLRGADLRRHLHPRVEVTRACERDAALVAAVRQTINPPIAKPALYSRKAPPNASSDTVRFSILMT